MMASIPVLDVHALKVARQKFLSSHTQNLFRDFEDPPRDPPSTYYLEPRLAILCCHKETCFEFFLLVQLAPNFTVPELPVWYPVKRLRYDYWTYPEQRKNTHFIILFCVLCLLKMHINKQPKNKDYKGTHLC